MQWERRAEKEGAQQRDKEATKGSQKDYRGRNEEAQRRDKGRAEERQREYRGETVGAQTKDTGGHRWGAAFGGAAAN